MKILLYVTLLTLCSLNFYAQENKKKHLIFEIQKRKINIDLDTAIFESFATNMYGSKNKDAIVIALYLPNSYEDQKLKIASVQNDKIWAEKKAYGKTIYTTNYELIKSDKRFVKSEYIISMQDNLCISLTTMLPVNAPKKDKQMIVDIVKSVLKRN
ncbi:hypothetical protein [uncultured Polaribacter sp.]|uniref:hypothetical protein n=1 Tax=uncultured Polaribacter sp. TaxID=174711 RepID=UPI002624EB6B|nr:hypothetical protein [uncultured Polaribacter sp.]